MLWAMWRWREESGFGGMVSVTPSRTRFMFSSHQEAGRCQCSSTKAFRFSSSAALSPRIFGTGRQKYPCRFSARLIVILPAFSFRACAMHLQVQKRLPRHFLTNWTMAASSSAVSMRLRPQLS